MSDTSFPDLDLRVFLRILRRRMWVVVLVPVIVTAAAYFSAREKTPLYRASAEILVGRTEAETVFNLAGTPYIDPDRLLANQVRVIESRDISDLADDKLGYPAGVSAHASKTEDVISISAVDRDPKKTADIVNAYAESYLDFRKSTRASDNAAIQVELRRQIDPAEARLKQLDDLVNRQPLDQQEEVRASQADERQLLLANLGTQKAQLAQLQASANVDKGGAQILAPAAVPGHPFEPNPRRSAYLGLAVGLMLALGLALLLDYLDNSLRGKEDLERAGRGLPVVGIIPTLKSWRDGGRSTVVSLDEPMSTSAEAYRSLRTALLFLSLDKSLRTFQITSPATSEGKTTTLVNLAVVLAKAGQRVVVVDCDLRRPRVHSFFGLQAVPGFTSVLTGEVSLDEALRTVPDVDGLRILPAGSIPPNPSELLASERTIEILGALEDQVDIVLVDSPPVLPVSDAAVLSSSVDAVVVVAAANLTHRRQVGRSLELLRQVDAVVAGTVLNRAKVGGVYGYYGYRKGGAERYVPSAPTTRRRKQHGPESNGTEVAANGNGAPKAVEAAAAESPDAPR